MKKIKLLVCILFSFALFAGCEKHDVEDQEKNSPYSPRILGGDVIVAPNTVALFPNPNTAQVLSPGESVAFTGLQFAPAGNVSVVWKVDDKQVATGQTYTFTATTEGDHRIKVEATSNGTTVSRFKDVFVLASAGAAFVPKGHTKIVMPYLGENGDITNINWNQITHLTFKAGLVPASGVLDLSKGETGRKAQEIVTRGHLKGVTVLLGVSAALSANGWNVYDSNNFGTALKNASLRTAMVTAIKDYITLRNFDGVDVMMADVGNTVEATTTANIAATITFINDLRTALGTSKIITLTVPVNYTHSNYTASNLTNVNWVNVRAFENGLYTGTGKPLGNPSPLSYMISSADIWKAKLPASKLVIGIPAMGVRHTAVDANGNNLSFTSYNYIGYKDILALNPTAFDRDKVDLAPAPLAIFYNGVPTVTAKAQRIKDDNYLGAYLWQGDFDVSGPNSLTLAIYNVLK